MKEFMANRIREQETYQGLIMKKIHLLMMLITLIPSSVFAKIYASEGKFYVQSYGERNPIFMVNDLSQKNLISKIKLFGSGKVHLISYAQKGEKEKLYSVDSSGYIYAIQPFADYSVSTVDDDGRIQFKEQPSKKYYISSKGYFLY